MNEFKHFNKLEKNIFKFEIWNAYHSDSFDFTAIGVK